MMQTDKIRENRLRLTAKRRGLILQKSKRRDRLAIDYGGFMLIDAATNAVVAGSSPLPYSLDLDGVEAWLADSPVG